ncbi:arginine/serine-rich protein 1 [Notolabrus celidotus]|uniref:arginine/serine-rich protein 1 n=1 Tax=Notolabrus celidotus TaxID=1203425 RepID=UPI00148F9B5E|nr:arginine/serine-rich protein 1 [Notolabrus celidotus]
MDSMAKVKEYHSEMAHARRSDGIDVIFDKNSPSSSGSRSGSSTACDSDRSPDSGHSRRRHRSSSSSSSSKSSTSYRPSSRSRSHPRCHRRSSRCHCDVHLKHGSGKPRSPSRRYKEKSRSHSRATLSDGYSHRRRNRSRSGSRSPRRCSRPASKSMRTHRSQSRSSESSVSLSLHDKKELLNAAKANAMKFLGVEKLDLPDSVKPILSVPPETTVTHHYTKTFSQNNEEEPDYVPSPKFSLKGKISFSINNSVVKPTVIPPSCAKVTPRMDSYESRKPYGHWVAVKSGRTSKARKHSIAMSH